jgi:cell wall-associated NlpC family hydrolase
MRRSALGQHLSARTRQLTSQALKEEQLVRKLGTALAAVLLAGAFLVPVSAKADEASADGVSSPSEYHLVAPDTRVEQRDVQAADAAGATADLKMWLGDKKATKDGTIRRFARGIVNRTSSIARGLTRNAMRFIGTPYVFGGTSKSGFDCSGYVQHVFAMMGIRVPRTADAQFYAAHKIKNGARPGDLVFFQTYAPGPSHVGIYLGSGKFVHSSSHGVRISRLANSYWAARFLGAKRVLKAH